MAVIQHLVNKNNLISCFSVQRRKKLVRQFIWYSDSDIEADFFFYPSSFSLGQVGTCVQYFKCVSSWEGHSLWELLDLPQIFPSPFCQKISSSLASTPKVIKSLLKHFTGNYLVGFEKKENEKVFLRRLV